MSVNLKPLTCWIVTEGMAGTENQCLGVAEALTAQGFTQGFKVETTVKRIGLRQPWKSLTPWLGFEQDWTFIPALIPPAGETWPDLVIASGRKSVAASRYIKRKSGNKTFTVQIQDPRTPARQFDLVSVPFHDSLRGNNVLVTDGAPNRLTQDKLSQAKEVFADVFSSIPQPRVAVLIGGTSKAHTMTPAVATAIGESLAQLKAGLMITASRRTDAQSAAALWGALEDTDAYLWDGSGENPYFGMLAWADYILVTEDSVSMISDAATTGKPVYVLKLEGGSQRFDKFHTHLRDLGITRPFKGGLEDWTYTPMQDAWRIAQEILRRIYNPL